MIRKKLTAIFAMTTLVAAIQTAQASVDLGASASLAALNNTAGAYLTIGDKIFSGFSFQAVNLSGFNASQITVTASIGTGGVDYLTFGGNIQLAGFSFATADLLLGYSVTATHGAISMIDQRYTGGAVNGSLLINETATSAGAPTAHSQLSVNDVSDPNTYPNGTFDVGENDLLHIVPPQTMLNVTKDLSFTILNGAPGTISQVSVSSVQQSFHQVAVPEPTTIIAGALLLLPFGASTLRILRKQNRAA
jgi:hypothetical protein